MKKSKDILHWLDQQVNQFASQKDSRFPVENAVNRFNGVAAIGFRDDGSEEPFINWLMACLPQKGNLLDVGAGDGRVALRLRAEDFNVTCLEPASQRVKQLKNLGFEVFQNSFMQFESETIFDHVLFCRSLGVAAIQDERVELSKALLKATELSSNKIIIVMPPEEILVHKAFRKAKLPLFKRPIFQYHLLQLLSLQVPIVQHSHSYYVTRNYEDVQDCIDQDFSKMNWNSSQFAKLSYVLSEILNDKCERRVHWMARYCEVDSQDLRQALSRG